MSFVRARFDFSPGPLDEEENGSIDAFSHSILAVLAAVVEFIPSVLGAPIGIDGAADDAADDAVEVEVEVDIDVDIGEGMVYNIDISEGLLYTVDGGTTAGLRRESSRENAESGTSPRIAVDDRCDASAGDDDAPLLAILATDKDGVDDVDIADDDDDAVG